jgi:hypothetical protein
MENNLNNTDWESGIVKADDPCESVRLLNESLSRMFNECFPLIKIKVSSRDPPFMSPLVKHLCKIRNNNTRHHRQADNVALQERINNLIRENQIRAVNNDNNSKKAGSRDWWNTVNRITGRKNQSIPVSSLIDPDIINSHFQTINTDANYSSPKPLLISEHIQVPTIDEHTVRSFLSCQKRTAPGPDEFPYWFWRDYSNHLAPVITKIFNSSIRLQVVPNLWKLANVLPIPKETPLVECDQLRPISLTNIIMRIFEKLVLKQELSSIMNLTVGNDQFAYKEKHNTTMALIKCYHNWVKWLDEDADFVRVFSFDFSKAFDTVPHHIVCSKLASLDINPYIINWIINFLGNRKQRVVVDGITTQFLSINRGVPQGSVLGPVLFALMVNDIRPVHPETNLLVKFADDTNLSVPVKANYDTSLAEVSNIQSWAQNNRMTLNMGKTKEMVVRGKTNKPVPPIAPAIERVPCLKLLGLIFQENPCNWDLYLENLLAKAGSRLYILRICKYYGYPKDQISTLFDSLVFSLILYGIEVWGAAFKGKYLDRVDKFLKRAYRYGYTSKNYVLTDIIRERDIKLWKIISEDVTHSLYELLPPKKTRTLRKRGHNFILPKVRTERYKISFINRCLFQFI